MKRCLTVLSLFIYYLMFTITDSVAQDTVWTQVFKYTSKTRDTMVQFPSGDHNQYEKILMYYSMRCKNALVSTTSSRNLGCGEWDYSCNTNVMDSSAVDSLKANHPNYIISGFSENFFPYTTKPTFTAYQYETKNIILQQANIESSTAIAPGMVKSLVPLAEKNNHKAYYIYRKEELTGFSPGNIQALRWNVSGKGIIDLCVIKLAKTSDDDLSLESLSGLPFTTVYERSLALEGPEKDLIFSKPFAYTANSHLILEVEYFIQESRVQDVKISFDQNTQTSGYSIVNDHYLPLGSQGVGQLPAQHMQNARKEISISFWSRGNVDILPNNNSIFYATDSLGNRQLNVHLPWSNGRVFWDCGFGGGSFDRIDKASVASEYEGEWNHWVFTKNSTNGTMKIYLNGALWHSATGKTKDIHIKEFFLGGNQNSELLYHGDLDDFCIWNKELSLEDINSIMVQSPSPGEDLFDDMLAHYDMNEFGTKEITDRSMHANKLVFPNQISVKRFAISEIFKGYQSVKSRPSISLIKGQFTYTTSQGIARDSIQNPPYKVTGYSVENGNLVEGQSRYLWQAGIFPVFNSSGEMIDELEFPEEDIIIVEPLTYYRKFPAKYELLSFVTPYGIGLDFGTQGKTWVFDVTDFGPVLKDKKRFFMDKGGEWQEEMNIRFAFIKGTPTRPVLSIQQVWPAEAYGYTAIINNQHLEPRTLHVEPEVASMKVRSVATGHGQEGEFIPRIHSLLVHNTALQWQLWKECADNPVYPQGGTWVYDRAGWCPGAPSDVREFEIMPMVGNANTFIMDYGLNTASGDSRYIVSNQLVKYGPTSFSHDAAILEIIAPSPGIRHHRKNPICANPEIAVQNNGSVPLTSIALEYWVEGYPVHTYTWTGNISFLQTANIVLPQMPSSELWAGGFFTVRINQVNNQEDAYKPNNTMRSPIAKTPFLKDGIIISMRTNSAPSETSWVLRDEAGVIIKQSRPNLNSNFLYNDTIRNMQGCYTLQFRDSDDDGISWWANGDGNGMIRAKGLNDDAFTIFQPDFGREFTYSFVAGQTNSEENIFGLPGMEIKPNPGYDQVKILIPGGSRDGQLSIMNQTGIVVFNQAWTDLFSKEEGFTIDVLHLPSGIYFFQYQDKYQRVTKKFIKI